MPTRRRSPPTSRPAEIGITPSTSACTTNGTIGYGEAKALLADVIEQHVSPPRHRYERLRAEPAALHDRLSEGEQHAARRADQVLTRAMTAMGL
jgi:tryptophanyl-tRNA synthetase